MIMPLQNLKHQNKNIDTMTDNMIEVDKNRGPGLKR